MSFSAKRSNYIDQRCRLLYNDGSFVMIGDPVKYQNKIGRIVNFDRQTVNIIFNDGSEINNIPIYNLEKADAVDQLIDEAPWIKK